MAKQSEEQNKSDLGAIDWESLLKQIDGPTIRQLFTNWLDSVIAAKVYQGKTIETAITELYNRDPGGGGNSFSNQFKILADIVNWDPSYFAAKYDDIPGNDTIYRTETNTPKSASQISIFQWDFDDIAEVISISGEIRIVTNAQLVQDQLQLINVGTVNGVSATLRRTIPFAIDGNWTPFNIAAPDEPQEPFSIASLGLLIENSAGNASYNTGLVLECRNVVLTRSSGPDVPITGILSPLDQTRTEYASSTPSPLEGTRVQLLRLTQAGQVPTVPATPELRPRDAGWLPTDILDGEMAINTVDGVIFYNRSGVISSIKVIENSGDVPLLNPSEESHVGTDVTVSDALKSSVSADIAIRDTLRQLIGAHATLAADPAPQIVNVAATIFDFIATFPSSNPDVFTVDDTANLLHLKIAGRFNFTTNGVVENSSSQDRTMYLRIVNNDTDVVIKERPVTIPKNTTLPLEWTVSTFETTGATNLRLELRADGTGVSVLALETNLSTSAGGATGNPNDKGFFPTEAALLAAHPVGQDGWYAIVGTTDTFWTWDSDTTAWKDSGVTSGGTGAYEYGTWRFQTSILPPPGSGNFRLNNATLANVTELYLSDIDDSGKDVSLALNNLLGVGDKFLLKKFDDAAVYVTGQVTANTDESGYVTVGVSIDSVSGSFSNNDKFVFAAKGGAGGGSSTPEWPINNPTTSGAIITIDLSTSETFEETIPDGTNTLTINVINANISLGRLSVLTVDNSVNNTAIAVVNFSSNIKFPRFVRPTGGLPANSILEFEFRNNRTNQDVSTGYNDLEV